MSPPEPISLYARLVARLNLALDAMAPAGGLDRRAVTMAPARDGRHGDLTSNAAMVLAAAGGGEPMALAARIAAALRGGDAIASVSVAPPGFVNIALGAGALRQEVMAIMAAGARYGAGAAGAGGALGLAQPEIDDVRSVAVAEAIARLLVFAGLHAGPADRVIALPRAGAVRLTHAGAAIDFDQACSLAGPGLLRHAMLMHGSHRPVAIEIAALLDLSRHNPVLSAHYAHARIVRLHRRALATGLGEASAVDLSLLETEELALVRHALRFPMVVQHAAAMREVERITSFVSDLASDFIILHDRGFVAPAGRILDPGQPARSRARLSLSRAIGQIVSNGLALIGVEAAEEL